VAIGFNPEGAQNSGDRVLPHLTPRVAADLTRAGRDHVRKLLLVDNYQGFVIHQGIDLL